MRWAARATPGTPLVLVNLGTVYLRLLACVHSNCCLAGSTVAVTSAFLWPYGKRDVEI